MRLYKGYMRVILYTAFGLGVPSRILGVPPIELVSLKSDHHGGMPS